MSESPQGSRPSTPQSDGVGPDAVLVTGAPRWVKVFGLVLLVLLVLFIVLKLVGVDHGPGRHTGAAADLAGLVSTPWSS